MTHFGRSGVRPSDGPWPMVSDYVCSGSPAQLARPSNAEKVAADRVTFRENYGRDLLWVFFSAQMYRVIHTRPFDSGESPGSEGR